MAAHDGSLLPTTTPLTSPNLRGSSQRGGSRPWGCRCTMSTSPRGRGRGRVRVGVRLTTQRLVQVGLPLGGEPPVVPMARVAGREIEIIGSHGLDAADMPAILQLVACGRLDPG